MSSKTALGAQGGERQVTVPLRDNLGPLDYKLTGDGLLVRHSADLFHERTGRLASMIPPGRTGVWLVWQAARGPWFRVLRMARSRVAGFRGPGLLPWLQGQLGAGQGLRQGADPVKITLG